MDKVWILCLFEKTSKWSAFFPLKLKIGRFKLVIISMQIGACHISIISLLSFSIFSWWSFTINIQILAHFWPFCHLARFEFCAYFFYAKRSFCWNSLELILFWFYWRIKDANAVFYDDVFIPKMVFSTFEDAYEIATILWVELGTDDPFWRYFLSTFFHTDLLRFILVLSFCGYRPFRSEVGVVSSKWRERKGVGMVLGAERMNSSVNI